MADFVAEEHEYLGDGTAYPYTFDIDLPAGTADEDLLFVTFCGYTSGVFQDGWSVTFNDSSGWTVLALVHQAAGFPLYAAFKLYEEGVDPTSFNITLGGTNGRNIDPSCILSSWNGIAVPDDYDRDGLSTAGAGPLDVDSVADANTDWSKTRIMLYMALGSPTITWTLDSDLTLDATITGTFGGWTPSGQYKFVLAHDTVTSGTEFPALTTDCVTSDGGNGLVAYSIAMYPATVDATPVADEAAALSLIRRHQVSHELPYDLRFIKLGGPGGTRRS